MLLQMPSGQGIAFAVLTTVVWWVLLNLPPELSDAFASAWFGGASAT